MYKRLRLGLLVILLIVFYSGFSQTKQFNAGLLLGFNGIHIEGDNAVLYNSDHGTIWGTGGIEFGIFVTRMMNKHLFWEMDLRFIEKGSVYEFNNTFGVQDYESIKIKYIEIPVTLGYKMSIGRRDIWIESGVATAKLLSKEKLISDYSGGLDQSLLEDFKDYDISWIIGAKLSLNKKKNLRLGAHFEYSLLSIHSAYNLHNMVYGVDLSYAFM